jgi:predicted dehydrogenase
MDGGTLGIAVVGCGYWGVNYLRVFGELPAAVRWAVDASAERRDFVAGRYPQLRVADDYRAALRDPAIDAVIVATPATSHFAIVRDALSAGKHCLVEKPLTSDSGEARQLAELADDVGRALMVGHTFLFNAGIRRMKEVMSEPSFGQVYYLHATRTNLGPIREDINALWDLAPHDVAILNHLLDACPEQVSAVGSSCLGHDGHEDVAFATLRYPGGVLGNIHVSWADPNKVREVVAVGSEQRVVFDDLNNLERLRIFHKGVAYAQTDVGSFGEFRLLMRDGDIVSPRIEASEPLKNQCRHFLEAIRDGRRPVSDGWLGVDVVRVLEATQASMRRDGAPVNLSPLLARA